MGSFWTVIAPYMRAVCCCAGRADRSLLYPKKVSLDRTSVDLRLVMVHSGCLIGKTELIIRERCSVEPAIFVCATPNDIAADQLLRQLCGAEQTTPILQIIMGPLMQ